MPTEPASSTQNYKYPLIVALASSFGTGLEIYDFLIYGFVAVVFSELFFPSSNPSTSLLLTFAVFATGFAGRPVGSVFFGHIGDKYGRKNTFALTMIVLAIVSLLTAVLPTYAQIGLAAPLALTILRFMQGFSLGGESGGGLVLTAEEAPKQYRALYTAIGNTGNSWASFFAPGLVALFSSALGASSFVLIGWRLLFLIGAAVGVVGTIIRHKLRESLIFDKVIIGEKKGLRIPIAELLSKYWKKVLLGIGYTLIVTVVSYTTGVFTASYLENTVKISVPIASEIVSLGAIPNLVFLLIFAFLADKYGRRPILTCGAIGSLVFVYPYFVLLGSGNFSTMLTAQVIFQIISAMLLSSLIVYLIEMFPTDVRYTGTGFSNNIAVGVFGGLTPFIASYLIIITSNALSPVIWIAAAAVVSLSLYVTTMYETARTDIAN